MARVDVPTLQCDRCGNTTQNLTVMSEFKALIYHHVSGSETWDLCAECWSAFELFIKGDL